MATSKGKESGASHDSSRSMERPDDRSSNAHRQLIGYVGLLLPIGLVVLVAMRPSGPTARGWPPLNSISAYYYSGAVAAFAGLLVALSFFLFTYKGYDNKYHWADRAAAKTASLAALGVAFFPTKALESSRADFWWTETTGRIHYASAVVLFLMFAIFALWLFRMSDQDTPTTAEKQRRNRVYLICGVVIVGSIAWAAINGLNGRSIFVPESVALVAFAISWLTKGHAVQSIKSGAQRATDVVTEGVRRITD